MITNIITTTRPSVAVPYYASTDLPGYQAALAVISASTHLASISQSHSQDQLSFVTIETFTDDPSRAAFFAEMQATPATASYIANATSYNSANGITSVTTTTIT